VGPAEGDSQCPACGQPLYGWLQLDTPAGPSLLKRCESCRLGVAAGLAQGDVANELLADARRLPDGALELRVANRDSWQARLGGLNWAALETGRGFYPTPRALELLAEKAGMSLDRVDSPGWGAGQVWMWQTIVNAFTFEHNFGLRWRARLTRPSGGSAARLKYALDTIVTLLATPLVLVVALPLELIAALSDKGGLLVARASRADPPQSSEDEYEKVDQ
jgi:hypothetical protein